MKATVRKNSSFSFTGSWSYFMFSGYFAWEKEDR